MRAYCNPASQAWQPRRHRLRQPLPRCSSMSAPTRANPSSFELHSAVKHLSDARSPLRDKRRASSERESRADRPTGFLPAQRICLLERLPKVNCFHAGPAVAKQEPIWPIDCSVKIFRNIILRPNARRWCLKAFIFTPSHTPRSERPEASPTNDGLRNDEGSTGLFLYRISAMIPCSDGPFVK